MKKFLFCISLAMTGLMTSCIEKYEEVDADHKPSWLGESIYAELKNPNSSGLTGTFSTYVRLIDDLGYAETLNRTGSKTVFPANDEAFQRFFSSNEWGVSSYEQLTEAQKKLLLYSSMLDNALLIGLLPNTSNGTAEPMKGAAVKHATNVSIIDSIQHIAGLAGMPKGNPYWERFYEKGIDVVNDNTRPMMVHLTREYMLNNDITTLGDESDFAIITGTPFTGLAEGYYTAKAIVDLGRQVDMELPICEAVYASLYEHVDVIHAKGYRKDGRYQAVLSDEAQRLVRQYHQFEYYRMNGAVR